MAEFYSTRRNDWCQEGNDSTTFLDRSGRYLDPNYSSNLESNLGHFWSKFWCWQRFALSEHSLVKLSNVGRHVLCATSVSERVLCATSVVFCVQHRSVSVFCVQSEMQRLQQFVRDSQHASQIIFFGHYPTSTIGSAVYDVRKLFGSVHDITRMLSTTSASYLGQFMSLLECSLRRPQVIWVSSCHCSNALYAVRKLFGSVHVVARMLFTTSASYLGQFMLLLECSLRRPQVIWVSSCRCSNALYDVRKLFGSVHVVARMLFTMFESYLGQFMLLLQLVHT